VIVPSNLLICELIEKIKQDHPDIVGTAHARAYSDGNLLDPKMEIGSANRDDPIELKLIDLNCSTEEGSNRKLVVKIIKGKLECLTKSKDVTYVEVCLNKNEIFETRRAKGPKPVWKETFVFSYNDKDTAKLHLAISLKNSNSDTSENLGLAILPLKQIKPGLQQIRISSPKPSSIKPGKGMGIGTIQIEIFHNGIY